MSPVRVLVKVDWPLVPLGPDLGTDRVMTVPRLDPSPQLPTTPGPPLLDLGCGSDTYRPFGTSVFVLRASTFLIH